ncbi:MAG: hypothetical protein L0Y68_02240 [Candidatus Dadabacteria bacterium]|nr:hypothetical protein [Candidatus Dadabacteria bacterium]
MIKCFRLPYGVYTEQLEFAMILCKTYRDDPPGRLYKIQYERMAFRGTQFDGVGKPSLSVCIE